MICTRCQDTACFHSHKPKTFVTLFGPVRFSRAYYRCRCGHSCFPFDQTACLTGRHLSLAAEELAALAGVNGESFREGAEVTLRKMAGLYVGESTVERITEEVGEQVGQELEAGSTYGEVKDFDWHQDAQGRTVAYLGIDATGVPQQGPKGAKADGRMPYVATIYNPPPLQREGQAKQPQQEKPKPMQARYLAGLYTLAVLGQLTRKQAAQVGMERAQVWVGLCDGGNGLESFVQTNFNREDLVLILDFYHPASRLEELSKLWHEGDAQKAQQTAEQWCKLMKHQGGEKLLEHLRAQPPPQRKTAKEKYREMLGYIENHKHKMDYPRYLKEGWHIGSGAVESACKTVVGQRLKLAGMRWGESGTDQVCHLRALLRSNGQWDSFWLRQINKGSPVHQPK